MSNTTKKRMDKGFTPTPVYKQTGVSPARAGRGFTLIELMVAISLFAVIMTIAMGSIINVLDANRRSHSLKTIMSNLNLAVESMAKEMRFGKNYHCGSSGTLTSPQNCPAGEDFISFLSSSNEQVTYRLSGGAIEKQVEDGGFVSVTAPEVVIDSLDFYTVGAGTGDTLQPKVIIRIQSHAGSGVGRTDFDLQTLVSQRALDI